MYDWHGWLGKKNSLSDGSVERFRVGYEMAKRVCTEYSVQFFRLNIVSLFDQCVPPSRMPIIRLTCWTFFMLGARRVAAQRGIKTFVSSIQRVYQTLSVMCLPSSANHSVHLRHLFKISASSKSKVSRCQPALAKLPLKT